MIFFVRVESRRTTVAIVPMTIFILLKSSSSIIKMIRTKQIMIVLNNPQVFILIQFRVENGVRRRLPNLIMKELHSQVRRVL